MQFSGESCFSRIGFTQVGDPLCHGKESRFHCISSDRVVGASSKAVAEGIDKEEPQATVGCMDFTEGRGDLLFLAEGTPVPKGTCLGASVLSGVGQGGEVESSLEISFKPMA